MQNLICELEKLQDLTQNRLALWGNKCTYRIAALTALASFCMESSSYSISGEWDDPVCPGQESALAAIRLPREVEQSNHISANLTISDGIYYR